MTGFFRFARRAALAAAMLAGGALMTLNDASARPGHGAHRGGGGGGGGYVSRGYSAPRAYSHGSFAPRAAFRPAMSRYSYNPGPRAYYAPRRHIRRGYYAAPVYYGGYAPVYYGRHCVIKKRWVATPWGWRKVRKRVCY